MNPDTVSNSYMYTHQDRTNKGLAAIASLEGSKKMQSWGRNRRKPLPHMQTLLLD